MVIVMMIRLLKRVKVRLDLFRKPMFELLGFGYTVVSRINGNTFFSVPAPDLSDVTTALDEFSTAIDNAHQGGQYETAVMYQKREIVEDLLTALGQYVEGVANDASNAGNGDAVVLSAGMAVKGRGGRQPQVFGVKNTAFPGIVLVTAAAVERGSHEWQYTTTPADANSWTSAPDTMKAHTFITGLNSGVDTYFRHRALLKDGYTPWDSTISIVVR